MEEEIIEVDSSETAETKKAAKPTASKTTGAEADKKPAKKQQPSLHLQRRQQQNLKRKPQLRMIRNS
ncbi:MAG: hypothetical protein HWD59_13425 [Coxiellaceae bacterium]|nr:MAG: hypothetical protein HWD59_13425 [Coxiellaceae bacterium]